MSLVLSWKKTLFNFMRSKFGFYVIKACMVLIQENIQNQFIKFSPVTKHNLIKMWIKGDIVYTPNRQQHKDSQNPPIRYLEVIKQPWIVTVYKQHVWIYLKTNIQVLPSFIRIIYAKKRIRTRFLSLLWECTKWHG